MTTEQLAQELHDWATDLLNGPERTTGHVIIIERAAAELSRLSKQLEEARETLRFYANAENWKEQETGIGMIPAEAHDFGATARAFLSK